jgi:hypothetical protein
MLPFNDTFLAPLNKETSLHPEYDNAYGRFIKLTRDVITCMQFSKRYYVVIGDDVQNGGLLELLSNLTLVSVRKYYMGTFTETFSVDNFLLRYPNAWILSIARIYGLGMMGLSEFNTHMVLSDAIHVRSITQCELYKLMIQWTHDRIAQLTKDEVVRDCAQSLRHPEAFESACMAPIWYNLANSYVLEIREWCNNNSSDLGNKVRSVNSYPLVRAMFKLMRARLIVLLRRFTQPDTARAIVCMVYKW